MKLRSQSTAGEDRSIVLVPVERRGGPLQSALYTLVVALLRPVERLWIRAGLSADTATLASLGIALGACIAAALGHLAAAAGLYLIAGAFDLLDGRIARMTSTVSPRGAALDSIVDRIAEGLVVGGLSWHLRSTPGLALCLVFLVASMGVSYARARGEGLGVSIEAGIMNRGPRVVLFALAMALEGFFGAASTPSLAFLLALGGLALLTILTAIVRVRLVLRALPGPAISAPRKASRLPIRRIR